MKATPQERAARAVEAYRQSADLAALQEEIASSIASAITEEQQGLRTTLQLCIQAFNEVLGLSGIPGELRAALRACRGLCLAGLMQEEDSAKTAVETADKPS
ncbi:MAG: hypothetical protein HYS12_11575 [Planctomycetes bacterium]|nr:hypothetical protein [Planctomycetota bacterium]